MKRTSFFIFTGALAVALGVLFWHRSGGESPRPNPRSVDLPAPPAREAEVPKPHAPLPTPPAQTPVHETGSLRVFVHSRGQALALIQLTLVGRDARNRMDLESGADGTRTVQNVPCADWVVTARHARFVPQVATVRVEPGRTAELTIELTEGARVYGRVTDASGQPLEAATVRLETRSHNSVDPDLRGTTDAAGNYAIDGIPLAPTTLLFRHPRHKPLAKPGLIFAQPGESLEVNAVLEPGATVSGRVLDESGAPIAGASVLASNETSVQARTDKEGRFAAHGLGDLPVSCSIMAKGYGTLYLREVRPNTTDLEVRLPKGGSISGRVEAASTPEFFAVSLTRYDEHFRKELRVRTEPFTQSPGGAFRIEDVTPGTYWIDIDAQDYEVLDRPQVVVATGQSAPELRVRLRKR